MKKPRDDKFLAEVVEESRSPCSSTAARTYKRNVQDSDVQALGDHEMKMVRILRGGNKAKNWIPALNCKRTDWP